MNHIQNIHNWVELSSGPHSIVTVIFGLLKDIAKMGKAIADLIGLVK
ncbi:hypothetical protein ACDL62_04340 [Corynebacterium diphtheriae]|nr:hypothetical protein [Corynebacterium diphtheriae]AEX81882.1 hypothetical protein CDHC04_1891 [Corynebacterium diphtheriae HC04]AEX81922.1 hypothetical protein CDHC04_1931 [Corynebacterium diphtheriae HC04]UJM21538.1 hypothetical protein FE377_09520 [Corynebacterium diphtheriae]CAB0707944.1 hypothetical protein FRC0037_01860 [Corynebacterium diphtheriae]CAB0708259.1 hypothetical protein FRC0031_01862 [Corynebacterium diphtheriae]